MPTLKRRHDHIRVYRPNGTRYTSARHSDVGTAIFLARCKFLEEFGYEPRQDHTVIECIGVTGDWVVDFLEVKE